ncbi:hypothetical protein GKC30_06345 [Pseudodesulfovibrio sp. F-1]|uniref:FecR protein domain-containing protein n=1 Tax=Pseudodesulfovibrio alkaliphilus TaxID=2661613 RepID=A0A7K1KMC9_9BACT|nr:FecR domain-containing protein [Pseudodesulfovibrio alkaliphilus]MUM77246.1 hypothetical protein [Pseudodesulfovibrio alkaliphilus]
MPEATQIGVVTIAYGTATAEGPDGVRDLAPQSPVFVDEIITTKGGASAVEIKFADGAVLSQGPNSSVVLDTYVFNPAQSAGEMTIKLVQGTFRSVTGEIVDMNPEGFSLETPLATIGIRGTTTGHKIVPGQPENHVVVDFVDKPVIIRPIAGGPVAIITQDGGMVTATPGGLSPVFMASQAELAQFEQLSSQSLQQAAPSLDGSDDQGDQDEGGQDESGSQNDEGGQEQGEGQETQGEQAEEQGQEAQGEQGEEQEGAEEQGGEPEQLTQGQGQGPGQGVGQNQGGVFDTGAGVGQGQGQGQGPGAQPPKPAAPPPPPPPPPPAQTGGTGTGDEGDETPPDTTPAQPAVVTTLDLSEWDANLTVNLQESPVYYEITGDQLSRVTLTSTDTTTYAIRTVYGSAHHDNHITGSAQGDSLYGGMGYNTLNGMCGNDYLAVGHYESEFNSYMLGPLSPYDTIDGGAGTDTLAFDGTYENDTLSLTNVTGIEHIQLGSTQTALMGHNGLAGAATFSIDASGIDPEDYHGIFFSWDGVSISSFSQFIVGSGGNDFIVGGSGNDTLFGGAGNDTLFGTGGNNVFFGTSVGNDSMTGGSGNDRFSMGTQLTADDFIDGGAGDDSLYFTGNTENTTALNSVTNIEHIILGNASTSLVYSPTGTGTITINGSAITSPKTLNYDGSGATQAQHIIGGAGNDTLVGGGGNDTIQGGAGADNLSGGTGGFNTLSYASSTAGVNINLAANTASGGHAQGDTLASGTFKGIIGSAYADSLTGTSASERFEGGAGHDSIVGGTGNDSIDGGDGNDILISGGGQDTIHGGAGNDTIVISAPVETGSVFDGGTGTNTLKISTNSASFFAATVAGISVVLFEGSSVSASFKSDQLEAWSMNTASPGTSVTITIQDTSGGDTIDLSALSFGTNWNLTGNRITVTSTGGNDLVKASATAETFNGSAGDVTVDYSASTAGVSVNLDLGENYREGSGEYAAGDRYIDITAFIGSAHNDIFTGQDDANNYFEGGAGKDRFIMSTFLDQNDTISGGAGCDTLEFTFVDDTMPLTNVTGIEHIILGDAATWLTGHDALADPGSIFTLNAQHIEGLGYNLVWNGEDISSFKQYIIGSNGNDSIVGGAGNDTLIGGDGQDWLEGGKGNNSIVGGGDDPIRRLFDVASYANETSGINVNLVSGTVTGSGINDTLVGINAVMGTSGNDTFLGNGDPINVFFYGGGSNEVDGGSEHDPDAGTGFDVASYEYAAVGIIATLDNYGNGTVQIGGAGNDTLSKIDMIWGSPHHDSFSFTGEGDFEVMPGMGNDTVTGSGDGWTNVTYWALDQLVDGVGITVIWNSAHWEVAGSNWTDTLIGVQAIEGTVGDDTFTGTPGVAIEFRGWAGNDIFNGNGGHVTVSYDDVPSGVNVNLAGGTASDGWGGTDTLNGIQSVVGSDFDDTLIGSDYADLLVGNDGDDEIQGGLGNDTLIGDQGDDILIGGDGFDYASYADDPSGVEVNLSDGYAYDGWDNTDSLSGINGVIGSSFDDTIIGNGDINILFGGQGADLLTGGGGSDTFAYMNPLEGGDTITDFKAGEDYIGLNHMAFAHFFTNGVFIEDNFDSIVSATYSSGMVEFGSGQTSGFVYASELDSEVGKLYFVTDHGTAEETSLLMATITEYSDASPGDNNLTYESFVEIMG